MNTTDINDDDITYICGKLETTFSYSNYVVFREKDNNKELFCIIGRDFIKASDISSLMNSQNDGWTYFYSDEVISFD